MDAPQMQTPIPAEALRLTDLRLQAGPREIEFEIELPKGCEWDLEGDNTLTVNSSHTDIVAPGQVSFEPVSMRFMVPVSALGTGDAILSYELRLAWRDKEGHRASEQRTALQRVSVERSRGATVPWVHYKAQAVPGGAARSEPVED